MPESNVILEYLEEAFPDPSLAPPDAYGRAKMRLWTKQLDEDVHDASAAILSFGIAFRHQYLERGEAGQKMLEQIPNVFKRERRRDVIEKGTGSKHFVIAVERMVLLLDEMEEALAQHRWLAGDDYTLADVAFTPYLARLEHLDILGMVGERHRGRRLVPALPGAAELPRCHRQVGECRLPCTDEAARRRGLAAGSGDHAASVPGQAGTGSPYKTRQHDRAGLPGAAD